MRRSKYKRVLKSPTRSPSDKKGLFRRKLSQLGQNPCPPRHIPSLQQQSTSSRPSAPKNILSSLTSSRSFQPNRNHRSSRKIIQRGRWNLSSLASSKWIKQQWCMSYKLVLTKTTTSLAQLRLCDRTSSSLPSSSSETTSRNKPGRAFEHGRTTHPLERTWQPSSTRRCVHNLKRCRRELSTARSNQKSGSQFSRPRYRGNSDIESNNEMILNINLDKYDTSY